MLDDALIKAAQRGDTQEVLAIINDAPVEARTQVLYLALLWAAINNQVATVQTLIGLGADVNASYYRGHRILSMAAKEGNLDVVKVLIAAGADILAKDPWGKTALDYAYRYRHSDVADLLRKYTGQSSRGTNEQRAQSP